MERLRLDSSLGQRALASYVAQQLSRFFPDREVTADELDASLSSALARVEFNFAHIKSQRYFDGRSARFDHLNTDQYCVFLYYLANTIHRSAGDRSIATKLYALNKALHGIDLFFEVEMPEIFGVQHPVGTVVGKAKLSNYLFLYQRCTIGGNLDLDYPVLDEGVVLFGDTAVLGRSRLDRNTWVSVGAKIIDTAVGPGQIVNGSSPSLNVRPTRRDVVDHFFRGHP